MSNIALTAPMTLDARQATTLRVLWAHLDFTARVVTVEYDVLDAGGNVLLSRQRIDSATASTQTWLTNQEATICNALMNKLGVTGTVT